MHSENSSTPLDSRQSGGDRLKHPQVPSLNRMLRQQ
jgi:hypothetical protein